MTADAATDAPRDEEAYWNEDGGPRWVALQTRIDALFDGLTRTALDRVGPVAGERVLDIGCGCGATVLQLAERVGPGGHVTAADFSRVMLARARERVAEAGLANVTLEVADASTHDFSAAAADLIFSRFGVMFFTDPAAAFANIRRGAKPGGRLAFLCWRPMQESTWFQLPYAAAKPHVPPVPKPAPDAPGPFAFADPDRVLRILAAAGFEDAAVAPFDVTLDVCGPGEADAATDFIVQIGPVSRALAGGDAAQRAAAIEAVRAAMRGAETREGLRLGAAMWLVTASV